jgi:hypothetical protein
MRPDGHLLPPGLILVAAFVNLNKVQQTNAIRLKGDPGSIAEVMDIVSQGAARLVEHGITAGDRMVLTLTAVLPHEPTPGMVVQGLHAHIDIGRRELQERVSSALVEMMMELVNAAAKPKAPPAPAPAAVMNGKTVH